jgi:hypothetical protein
MRFYLSLLIPESYKSYVSTRASMFLKNVDGSLVCTSDDDFRLLLGAEEVSIIE